LAVRRGERLTAVVPFTRGPERIHGVSVTTLRLLGEPFADRLPLPIAGLDEASIAHLFDAFYGAPARWDVLLLSELAIDAGTRAMVDRWAQGTHHRLHWRHCSRSPVLRLDFPDQESLRRSYSKTLRTRLARARKKLAAAGSVRFQRECPTPARLAALLPEIKAVEAASWKGRAGSGIFSTGERSRFFEEVSETFAAAGVLELGGLWLDGRLISYRYGFRFRGRFYDYNLAYHPDFAALSPGRVLLDEMVVSSLAEGLEAVDASRGSLDAPHLLADWSDEYIDHHQLWLFGRSLRATALYAAREHLRPRVAALRRRITR